MEKGQRKPVKTTEKTPSINIHFPSKSAGEGPPSLYLLDERRLQRWWSVFQNGHGIVRESARGERKVDELT